MADNNNNVSFGLGQGGVAGAIIPTLFAQGLMSLRSMLVMPGLVTNHFGTEARKKGETILVPMPSTMAANNVVPAAFAPDPQGIAPADAAIPLTNWQEAAFTLTEQDVGNIIDGIAPMQLSSAMQALAFAVNQSIFQNYQSVPNVVADAQPSDSSDTSVVTPFASSPATATQAGSLMTTALSPLMDRRIVLSPGAYGSALVLPQFAYALYAGDKDAVDSGIIRRKFGFDWAQDQQVPFHTAGTATGATVGTGGIPALNPSSAGIQGTSPDAIVAPGGVPGIAVSIPIAITSGSLALNAGDVLQFFASSGSAVAAGAAYGPGLLTATVVAPVTASANISIPVVLGSAAAINGVPAGYKVAVVPSHMANLAFHRDAFAFASRPLENNRLGVTSDDLVHQVSDPVSGISLRLILRPEYHRTRAAFDILWGTAPIRPQLACRIMGGVNG